MHKGYTCNVRAKNAEFKVIMMKTANVLNKSSERRRYSTGPRTHLRSPIPIQGTSPGAGVGGRWTGGHARLPSSPRSPGDATRSQGRGLDAPAGIHRSEPLPQWEPPAADDSRPDSPEDPLEKRASQTLKRSQYLAASSIPGRASPDRTGRATRAPPAATACRRRVRPRRN